MPAFDEYGHIIVGREVINEVVEEYGLRAFYWPIYTTATPTWPLWAVFLWNQKPYAELSAEVDKMEVTYQGDTAELKFTVYDKDGNLYDLTNAEVRFTLKNGDTTIKKANSLVSGGADTQINVTDAENGELVVYLLKSETANLSGPCDCELEVTDSTGKRFTVWRDFIQFKDQLTTWEEP